MQHSTQAAPQDPERRWLVLAKRTQLYADTGKSRAYYEALRKVYGPSHQMQAPLRSVDSLKKGCVLAPTLFAIFFSMMLREANEDLHEGVDIRFRTDGSVFNVLHLIAHTKTLDLLFADNCALLAHTEAALQVAQAAKAFG